MKLIVGLGNPGKKYSGTRHNVGFEALSLVQRRLRADPPRGRFQGDSAEAKIGAEKALLLWPLTYMNLSGASVLEARDFYKVENENVLVVCDDFALPLGKLRLRAKGSSGGQKGLEDILRRLGTEEIPRLRIGIGPVPPQWDPANFVLGKFTSEEQPLLTTQLERAAEAAIAWAEQGLTHCMNQYNA